MIGLRHANEHEHWVVIRHEVFLSITFNFGFYAI